MSTSPVPAGARRTASAFLDVTTELRRARSLYEPFNSAHEGWATLYEEVDELWEEVRKKPAWRSKERMRTEAIQIAAMALRFIEDCCDVEQVEDDNREMDRFLEDKCGEQDDRWGECPDCEDEL